jgi:hypothetical protein
MNNMELFKIGGLLAAWAGVTLAQLNLLVQIAVGVVTFAYILTKLIKAWRTKE